VGPVVNVELSKFMGRLKTMTSSSQFIANEESVHVTFPADVFISELVNEKLGWHCLWSCSCDFTN
jgi:hypothetical protein